MKTKFYYLPIALLFYGVFAYSCARIEPQCDNMYLEETISHSLAVNYESGIVSLNSMYEFNQLMDIMSADESVTISMVPLVKSDTSGFTSLRQSLIDQGLRSFTDKELAMIQEKGLIYEPEDSLIKDPNLISVLNQNREIKIGSKVYRYVSEGVIVSNTSLGDTISIDITPPIQHGEVYPIDENSQLIGIDYDSGYTNGGGSSGLEEIKDDAIGGTISSGGNSGNGNGSGEQRSYNITLSDDINIPYYDIRRVAFVNGEGEDDSNAFEKFISSLFGSNIVAENNFDDRHRMKLNMFAQDYIIYRSVGMKVRMQERFLGIWWRKKAEEFRYGWSNIECIYTYHQEQPFGPENVPDVMSKSQGYLRESGINMFYVPYAQYNTWSGFIDDVLGDGLEEMQELIEEWGHYGTGFGNNENSIYTTKTDGEGMKVIVVYPQGEERAYNTGKEKVAWGYEWFRGNFQISFKHLMTWIFDSLTMEPACDMEIARGQIYAAVKYNGKWKACVIETRTKQTR